MKKINIAKILKDCPSGIELDCTMYDSVTLLSVDDKEDINFPIKVVRKDGYAMVLTKYGQYIKADFAKCVIFPKGKTTWEGFQRPFKDGDVVTVTMIPEGIWIGIFKQYTAMFFESYCSLNTRGEFRNTGFANHSLKGLRFATEEEKQKLFDAIKENGYRWNDKTKTLEKLIEPVFEVGDRIRYKRGNRVKLNIESININEQFYYTSDKGRVYFKYQDDWELVHNKFDISSLRTYESKVLVRGSYDNIWKPAIYGFNKDNITYVVGGSGWIQCVPYENNEHLLGTTDDCDEYYKTCE